MTRDGEQTQEREVLTTERASLRLPSLRGEELIEFRNDGKEPSPRGVEIQSFGVLTEMNVLAKESNE